jgi:hypothetical protein
MVEAFAYVSVFVGHELEVKKIRFLSEHEHCGHCMDAHHGESFGCCCRHVSEALQDGGVRPYVPNVA